MSPEYLAGFFDGEGCIDVQRMYPGGKYRQTLYVRPRLRITQAMSGRVVIDRIASTFGGSVHHRKVQQNPRAQDSVSWECCTVETNRRLLNIMLPHLIVKREQAILALWWFDNAHGRQVTDFPGIVQARQTLIDELVAMKRDPQRLSEGASQRILMAMLQSEPGSDVGTKAETTLARAA